MSWSRTYTHTLAIAVDMATASLLWNDLDICVSSLCALARRMRHTPAQQAVLGKFGSVQLEVLLYLGDVLEMLQTDHCELSLASDIARAEATVALR